MLLWVSQPDYSVDVQLADAANKMANRNRRQMCDSQILRIHIQP